MLHAFHCSIFKLGVFGSSYQPKVIWLGVSEKEKFQEISLHINKALLKAGIALDSRPLVPHITLGRIKRCNDKNNLRSVVEKKSGLYDREILISSFHLIESHLTSKGPIYKKLQTMNLV